MSGLYFGMSAIDNSIVVGNLIDLAGSKFILSKDDIAKVFVNDDGTFRLPLIPVNGDTIKKAYEWLRWQ